MGTRESMCPVVVLENKFRYIWYNFHFVDPSTRDMYHDTRSRSHPLLRRTQGDTQHRLQSQSIDLNCPYRVHRYHIQPNKVCRQYKCLIQVVLQHQKYIHRKYHRCHMMHSTSMNIVGNRWIGCRNCHKYHYKARSLR